MKISKQHIPSNRPPGIDSGDNFRLAEDLRLISSRHNGRGLRYKTTHDIWPMMQVDVWYASSLRAYRLDIGRREIEEAVEFFSAQISKEGDIESFLPYQKISTVSFLEEHHNLIDERVDIGGLQSYGVRIDKRKCWISGKVDRRNDAYTLIRSVVNDILLALD